MLTFTDIVLCFKSIVNIHSTLVYLHLLNPALSDLCYLNRTWVTSYKASVVAKYKAVSGYLLTHTHSRLPTTEREFESIIEIDARH